MTPLHELERNVLAVLRQCTTCVALDRLGYTAALTSGLSQDTSTTAAKALAAAEVLNVVERAGDDFRWSPPFLALASDPDGWQRFLHVILHQMTYVGLADALGAPLPPINQSDDAIGYRHFLQGVAASHIAHAPAFAAFESLQAAEHLVDLGCGLGTFSAAWIASRATRTATCVDLPRVVPFMREALRSPRVTFVGADLNDAYEVPHGEVYLLANVLHLLPRWRDVLEKVAGGMPPGATLVVMEADPTPPPGKLFDFQVHLRSGATAGLVAPSDIHETFARLGMSVTVCTSGPDETDPFERTYHWWLARGHPEPGTLLEAAE